jgi:pyruvate dehydrogenase E1 component
MYEKQENIFYYLTVMNEFYKMPAMPKNSEEGILKGIYKFKESEIPAKQKVHLFGSGTILNEAVKAQKLLTEKFGIPADVWSVTSYKELLMDAQECERWNMLHPGETPRIPYIKQALKEEEGFFVAASDYMKILPDSISRWIPGDIVTLGTDGFGRSDGRTELRDFFEVDERYITLAALNLMLKHNKIKVSFVKQVMKDFGIDSEKPNPVLT